MKLKNKIVNIKVSLSVNVFCGSLMEAPNISSSHQLDPKFLSGVSFFQRLSAQGGHLTTFSLLSLSNKDIFGRTFI